MDVVQFDSGHDFILGVLSFKDDALTCFAAMLIDQIGRGRKASLHSKVNLEPGDFLRKLVGALPGINSLDQNESIIQPLGDSWLSSVDASYVDGETGLEVVMSEQNGAPGRKWAKWCNASSATEAELLAVEFGMIRTGCRRSECNVIP